jgi:hypothetical protein
MPAASRSATTPRNRLPLTPAVTTVRRGSHRPRQAAGLETPKPTAVRPADGVSLLSSARGVRLDRVR